MSQEYTRRGLSLFIALLSTMNFACSALLTDRSALLSSQTSQGQAALPIPGADIVIDDFSSARLNSKGTPLFQADFAQGPNQNISVTGGELSVSGDPSRGLFIQMLPLSQLGGDYAYPAGYAQAYVQKGVWDPKANRLRFDMKCDLNISRTGSPNVSVGASVKSQDADPNLEGTHYSHLFSPSFYIDHWVHFELNRVPQRMQGAADDINFNENPTEARVEYFNGLTRLTVDAPGTAFGQAHCTFDNVRFVQISDEPDLAVSSLTSTYSGARYELTWSAPKNVTTTYEIRYSLASLKSVGFTHGLDGGTVTSSGGTTSSAFWISPPLSESDSLFVAIRPQNSQNFTEVEIRR